MYRLKKKANLECVLTSYFEAKRVVTIMNIHFRIPNFSDICFASGGSLPPRCALKSFNARLAVDYPLYIYIYIYTYI